MDKIDDGTYNDIIEPRIRGNAQRWPNGIVPYMIDNEFSKKAVKLQFNISKIIKITRVIRIAAEEEKVSIAQAVTIFQNKTCVRVIARTTEENYVLLKKNSKSEKCAGYVGMMGGQQVSLLAKRCVSRIGSTIHELMHTLGFYHEQGRPDRDGFITIHYDNIREGNCLHKNKVY